MSTYEKVRHFLDTYIVRIGSSIIILAVGAAIAAAFIPPLENFLVSQRVYEVLIIALLVDITIRLVDMRDVPPLQITKDQSEAIPVLIQHIRKKRPETVKMFEYSTYTIGELLKELREQQVQIKLLIFDPDGSPISDQQEAIIRNQLRLLKTHILRDYSKVEIRMYSTPASLRGRRFGNLLNVGWYTYFHHEGGIDLEGGGNPMLLIDAANTTEGSALADMFEQA